MSGLPAFEGHGSSLLTLLLPNCFHSKPQQVLQQEVCKARRTAASAAQMQGVSIDAAHGPIGRGGFGESVS